jgi:hypothetical protein
LITEVATTVLIGCLTYMPGLCLKAGVEINGAHMGSEMQQIVEVAIETAPMLERGTVWITSANDSIHHPESLHYKNLAYDIRIWNIIGAVKAEARSWAERMQVALGDDYDVLLERDHIHVEYDPEEPE